MLTATSSTWKARELSVITVGQPDAVPSMIVYISSANAVIADDVVYEGNRSLSDSGSDRELADTTMAVPGNPGDPYMLRVAAGASWSRDKEHRQEQPTPCASRPFPCCCGQRPYPVSDRCQCR